MSKFESGLKGISIDGAICHKCKHIHERRLTCDAFPNGIPGKILTGDIKHTRKYQGDNGIQFEARDNE